MKKKTNRNSYECNGSRVIEVNFNVPRLPTQKQLDFIQDIETYTGIEFIGNTIDEASEYISANIEDYYFQKSQDETDGDDFDGIFDFIPPGRYY